MSETFDDSDASFKANEPTPGDQNEESLIEQDNLKSQLKREKIEEIYQNFIEEHGEVKYNNLEEYLKHWSEFIDFINRDKINIDSRNFNAAAGYDMGYRFEIDTVLKNVEISPDDKNLLEQYLLSLEPVYNFNRTHLRSIKHIKDDFIKNIPDPTRMLDSIDNVSNESRIHHILTGGTFPLIRASLSYEQFEKIPDQWRDWSEEQRLILDNQFPEDCEKIWHLPIRNNLDATLNHAPFMNQYLGIIRNQIIEYYGLDNQEINDNQKEEEFANLLTDRIKKEFGVDLKDLADKIIELQ
jgi:hypothetical protein